MTPQKYLAILDENLALADSDWFDDPDFEFSEEFTYSGAAAIELLEQGITLWDCPGWVADIAREFEVLRFGDNLVRVRLTAEWLLSTAPEDALDNELVAKLRYLAEGQFSVVYEGCSSALYQRPEYYLAHLNLNAYHSAKAFEDAICRVAL